MRAQHVRSMMVLCAAIACESLMRNITQYACESNINVGRSPRWLVGQCNVMQFWARATDINSAASDPCKELQDVLRGGWLKASND